jgi:hypothetical protein
LVLAMYGAIALAELTNRRQMSQEFLSAGAYANADQVELEVAPGRGTPVLEEVQVDFRTTDGQKVHTSLVEVDIEAQVAPHEGRQTPEPGSRYAPPLKILYMPRKPSDAIAVADVDRLVTNDTKYHGWAAAGIGVGLVSLMAAAVILGRQGRTLKRSSAS